MAIATVLFLLLCFDHIPVGFDMLLVHEDRWLG